jgi:hypothetical protein
MTAEDNTKLIPYDQKLIAYAGHHIAHFAKSYADPFIYLAFDLSYRAPLTAKDWISDLTKVSAGNVLTVSLREESRLLLIRVRPNKDAVQKLTEELGIPVYRATLGGPALG